jgi:hypothetical protein
MAVKGATKMRPLAKAPGAQFEISIDGTPRTYRDRKAFAIEAAARLKRKHSAARRQRNRLAHGRSSQQRRQSNARSSAAACDDVEHQS